VLDTIRQCMSRAMKLDAKTTASITEKTTAGDVPGWTSVAHLTLVLELEKAFRITFDNDEIVSMGSVAAIADRLKAKGVVSDQ
jgi:acyl carrier protein